MSSDDDVPTYACRCLNIRLCNGKTSKEGAQHNSQQDASAEYLPLYVGDEGIKISHNELTLRTRSRVVADSTSSTGHTQQTLVTCLVCDTAAYRVKTEVPPDEDAKEGPILPTEDWAERDTLRSKSGDVDVHVGTDGCIAQDEIKRLLESPSYSQYFSLAMPSESHVLSTTAPPLLPQARLTIPPSHSFLPDLPPFLPPPPFTPSHPIFLHLSSIVTATSNDARRDTEKRIENFARQELARLEEHEMNLRTQLERIWWIVKEGLRKAEQERDASLLLALKSRRRSMSPHHPPSCAGDIGSVVVRNFVPSTYHTPRAIRSSAAHTSALSASLATTSFHHPRAQQDARSDLADVRGHLAPLTPSPPPYTSNPSSSRNGSVSESPTVSIAIASRSFKRNMNESNDAAATYRYFVIEEQEAARRKAKERAEKNRNNEVTREKKGAPDPDSRKQASSPTPQAEERRDTTSTNDKLTSPKKKDSRRKVTFNIEPNVVTIKRDIIAEAEDEQLPEKGEDLLFEMDVVDPNPVERDDLVPAQDDQNVQNSQNEAKTENSFHEPAERPQRSGRRQMDLKDAGLPQSFAALRPSSLPAPSHIRPPVRSRTRSDDSETKQLHVPQASGSSQAKDIKRQSEGDLTEEVLSPERKDFLKLVAAETPSHRGFWKPGSDSWKIFDRNRGHSSSGTQSQPTEDDDVENPPSNVNGRNKESTDLDWRHYRTPDVVGSLPIPMAPIAQQKPAGSLSLRPKSSLTDRPGTLVPPLPSLPAVPEEEEEEKEKRSAASIRKEVYAERNKARGLDPGILDFIDDDDDEGEGGSPEPEDPVDQVSTSRSRQHALEIIRTRNAAPPEGLWRSLAT
ncbi:hypothetical protein A7U60_g8361 [Sanghuangporus baumii]|uniref:Uncharacterized protein n=1 Tax=Sanghuangporus baumii TaxID=108892 RepID=A0A9Q5MY94_SANBA|nr:hypothetical protein A7U60_g8361 [Sanghuangporus baumii]